jgi:hypothetical protein
MKTPSTLAGISTPAFKSISPLAIAFLLAISGGATPAAALDWSSSADISGSYVEMSTYSSIDYFDCVTDSYCEAYAQGQEYVNGAFATWSDDTSSSTAEVDIWDYAVSGVTYTMEGFHYFYNDYLQAWENFGYDTASVTAP